MMMTTPSTSYIKIEKNLQFNFIIILFFCLVNQLERKRVLQACIRKRLRMYMMMLMTIIELMMIQIKVKNFSLSVRARASGFSISVHRNE